MISDNIKPEEMNSSNELGKADIPVKSLSDQADTVQDQVSSLKSEPEAPSKSKSCEDGAIILLADEETDLAPISSDNQAVVAEGITNKEIINTDEKTRPTRSVWISNISKRLKAIDLKKLFSKHFKVQCARIITNGFSFFGYITLENHEMARDAITMFNGFTLNKRKISVSLRRPDLKAKPQSYETENHSKTEILDEEPIKEKIKKKIGKEEVQKTADVTGTNVDIIENLRKELSDLKSDYRRTKERLQAAYRLLDEERDRKSKLLKEVGKLQFLLKKEQRKFDEEKSYWEKKLNAESARYYTDRSIINRELDECKRLRECLESNMAEMNSRNRQRSVSPFNRERHHATKSGERQPTPPPAPKLSKHSPIKRNKPSTYQRGAKRTNAYSNNMNANMYQRSGPFQPNHSPWANVGYPFRQNEPPSTITNYSANNGTPSMVPRPNVYTNFQKPFSTDSRRY